MQRREVLATVAALSTGGLAGCIAGTGADGTTTPESTTTDAPGTTADPTTATDSTTDPTTDSGGTATEDGTTTDADETTTDADETTTDAGGTPTGDAGAFDRSFEVTDAGCAEGTSDEADARFTDDGVAVAGTIPGNNGCYAARLAGADYDDGADELVVTVESFVESEADTCTQCLVAIDYEASFTFEGSLPGTVVVRHREGDDVRTVTRASP